MPPPDFVTFSDLISEPERLELHDNARLLMAKKQLQVNQAGPNRFFIRIWDTPMVTPLIEKVARRVETKFNLDDCPVDVDLGWVISVILPGGFIHSHTDAISYAGRPYSHFRCNVVVARPEEGGTPIISGKPVPVMERGGWAFLASEHTHMATAVEGQIPRIIYQFGYRVPASWSLPVPVEEKVA